MEHPGGSRVGILAAELSAMVGKLRRRLREEAGVGDLTPSQLSVVVRLEKDGPATVSSLARVESMRPQSMAAVVAALEAAGHVTGAPDPNDRRQTLLSITEPCRQWVQEKRAARRDWLSRSIAARLGPQEQETLAAALELLKRLIDE